MKKDITITIANKSYPITNSDNVFCILMFVMFVTILNGYCSHQMHKYKTAFWKRRNT